MTDDGTPRTAAGRDLRAWLLSRARFAEGGAFDRGTISGIFAIEAEARQIADNECAEHLSAMRNAYKSQGVEARALVTPDPAPEIEAAWEALKRDLDELAADPRSRHYTTDYHRPIIEAAIRAQGGGLDVERLAEAMVSCDGVNWPKRWLSNESHDFSWVARQVAAQYARLSEADPLAHVPGEDWAEADHAD